MPGGGPHLPRPGHPLHGGCVIRGHDRTCHPWTSGTGPGGPRERGGQGGTGLNPSGPGAATGRGGGLTRGLIASPEPVRDRAQVTPRWTRRGGPVRDRPLSHSPTREAWRSHRAPYLGLSLVAPAEPLAVATCGEVDLSGFAVDHHRNDARAVELDDHMALPRQRLAIEPGDGDPGLLGDGP